VRGFAAAGFPISASATRLEAGNLQRPLNRLCGLSITFEIQLKSRSHRVVKVPRRTRRVLFVELSFVVAERSPIHTAPDSLFVSLGSLSVQLGSHPESGLEALSCDLTFPIFKFVPTLKRGPLMELNVNRRVVPKAHEQLCDTVDVPLFLPRLVQSITVAT
jgi:hypothetical protein